jgi:hypothetical protein
MDERQLPEHVGYMSTEGGSVLLLSAAQASGWHGAGGTGADLERANQVAAEYGRPGTPLPIDDGVAIVWSVPTGTTSAWRLSTDVVVLTRSWLEESDSEEWPAVERRLAAASLDSSAEHGPDLSIPSGWMLILWSPEDVSDVVIPHEDGASLDLSIDESSLVVRLDPGTYSSRWDFAHVGANSASRCMLTRRA